MRRLPLLMAAWSVHTLCTAQLRPGFDRTEYTELLRVFAAQADTTMEGFNLPKPERFSLAWKSPVVGLDNRWDLYTDSAGTAVVVVRGTTAQLASWLENFHSVLVPAQGELDLDGGEPFRYTLSDDPAARVHLGWLIGLGHLQRTILPAIDSLYAAGTRQVILAGHSQGGAITYLLTAHLWQLRASGRLPTDLVMKTYCSAAPKPGNLPFAYGYEATHREGWAMNVVNSADWVPEVPVTVQTVDDFNPVNPFRNARKAIRALPFPQDIGLRILFNRLDRPTRKARRNYQRVLGRTIGRLAAKNLPGYTAPELPEGTHFVRTGPFVVLRPDATYRARFVDDPKKVFMHHLMEPYHDLMMRFPDRVCMP
ncbi:MAG TPA: lipase family protein [Flavobacteriales bacterium]|nr:lipase family protein [Flavobacteriales bacterium]HMR27990.1 lipase family protein [Flavobacteriales bacterium]